MKFNRFKDSVLSLEGLFLFPLPFFLLPCEARIGEQGEVLHDLPLLH